jgi:hypothetical protein
MFGPAAQLEAAMTARARRGARHAALLTISAILLATGVAFLTAALWIVAAAAWSAGAAALLLAMIYLGLGGIVLALALSRRRRVPPSVAATPPPQPAANPYAPMIEAFIFGLDTAIRLRRRRDPASAPR